ncbi:MAG: T9SS type A sorting domain-containing protein, partial [Candidatus Kapaibacterium sp.]
VFAETIVNKSTMQLFCSTDNGKDWFSNTMDIPNTTYSMGFFCFPHCNDLLRTFISFALDPKSDVYQISHSSDFGAHWDNLYHPLEIGAWIAGTNCVQYVCDAQGFQFGATTQGLWRSTDRAKNWSYVNGPTFEEIDDVDYRNLSVVGGGAVVYAGDHIPFSSERNLWKTTTGGDGTLSAAQFASQISIQHKLSSGTTDTLQIKVCDTGTVIVPFQNISCNVALFQSIKIDSLSSSEFSTQLIHHLYCDGLPDTLLIRITPSFAGNRTITVHPRFINDDYQTIDTSFTFTLEATSATGTSIYLPYGALTAAASDSIDIPLNINNSSPVPVLLGLDSIELVYHLNTDLVSPFSFVPMGIGIKADPLIKTSNSVSVMLHFPLGFKFTGETMLGKLRCKIYVADTFETDIDFSGNAQTSPCASILSNSTVHFSLTAHCEDSLLSNFMKYGNAFSIQSITPNPARNTVHIELKNTGGELRYEVYDALGIQRKTGIISGNSFQLNLSDLSDGSYYLRLSGERGIPITKKIVVAK